MSAGRKAFGASSEGMYWLAHAALALVIVAAMAAISNKAIADEPSMSERIDQLLADRWKAAGVEPAAAAEDSELLRRLYLDLTGVIPSVWETRAYLSDDRPEKYDELVDRLLHSPAYATHLADVWRDMMLPRKF